VSTTGMSLSVFLIDVFHSGTCGELNMLLQGTKEGMVIGPTYTKNKAQSCCET